MKYTCWRIFKKFFLAELQKLPLKFNTLGSLELQQLSSLLKRDLKGFEGKEQALAIICKAG